MRPNLAKPFSIAGFILAEIYMVFTVLAPMKSGIAVPIDHQILRLVVCAIFFGPFGALVGMGIGLLVSAVLPRR